MKMNLFLNLIVVIVLIIIITGCGGKKAESVLYSEEDDKYEPNNIRVNSYNLSSYINKSLSSLNGKGIQNDDDWYQIYISSGYERVYISCTFTNSDGDINIELYNNLGIMLTESATTSNIETIDYIVSASGNYYIKVFNANNGNSYDLIWNKLDPNSNVDDSYEENDTMASAYDLSSHAGQSLSEIEGNGTLMDEDWYQISVKSGSERVIINCDFNHSEGDIDIELYDSSGNLITSSNTDTNNESIDYTVSKSGTYFIKVYNADNGNTYDLSWDNIEPVINIDDSYEENDTIYYAYNLAMYEGQSISTINGNGIQFDADWYQISVASGKERVVINCDFIHSKGDIDIALYDISGVLLISSKTSTDNETIDTTVSVSGIYYIFIYGTNLGNTYNLTWNNLDPDSSTDDNYEENDTISTAFDLSLNEGQPLSLNNGIGIQEDDDWYKIFVKSGNEKVLINCEFIHSKGDIDIALYNSTGTMIIISNTTSNNETINYRVSNSGTYFIKIYNANNGNTYNLTWDDHNPDILFDDNYEENDTKYSAYNLSLYEGLSLSTIEGTGLQSDDDWYMINVSASCIFVHLRVTFNTLKDIHIKLYDHTGKSISKTSTTETASYIERSYAMPYMKAGIYYIRLSNDDTGESYDMWWEQEFP